MQVKRKPLRPQSDRDPIGTIQRFSDGTVPFISPAKTGHRKNKCVDDSSALWGGLLVQHGYAHESEILDAIEVSLQMRQVWPGLRAQQCDFLRPFFFHSLVGGVPASAP